tara:strand:- start:3845 stop:4735 length:891 start_codon:yes stop_codon:yes gene_type:complete
MLDHGVHLGTSEELYRNQRDEKGFRVTHQSDLKPLAETTDIHYRHALMSPSRTDSMSLGQQAHARLLERSEFEKRYFRAAVQDDNGIPIKTHRGSKAWKELVAANPDKEAVRWEDWDLIETICTRVLETQTGRALLLPEDAGQNELVIRWADQDTGVECTGRIDRFAVVDGVEFIVDFKTSSDAVNPTQVSRALDKWAVAMQAAFYMDGYALASGKPNPARVFALIYVETKPPHGVAFYELGKESIEIGRYAYKACLRKVKRIQDTNEYRSYPDALMPIELPPWARDGDGLLEGEL